MRRRSIATLAVVLAGAACIAARPSAAGGEERFVVFYGADASPSALTPYRRAVLDSDHHPALAPLRAAGTALFGYLSLGEVETTRAYFARAAQAGLLLAPNPDWPEARLVDLRKPGWRAMVLDELVPAILAEGFDGLFLDTLDDAAQLEAAQGKLGAGAVAAGAELVAAIHARFPSVPLMLNRAYDVGLKAAPALESVLAESLLTTYDFKSHRYVARSRADIAWGRARLAELMQANPGLKLFSLDYWAPTDTAGIARLYAREREAGLIPYVATIDLQRIIPEPSALAVRP